MIRSEIVLGDRVDQHLIDSLTRLENWAVRSQFRGYEPFDGLNSWLRPLAFNRLGRQAFVQVGIRSRVNLRPPLGIKPATSTKAMGYFARGYLKLYQVAADRTWLDRARYCLDAW